MSLVPWTAKNTSGRAAFLWGFRVEETGKALDILVETFHRGWKLAKVWLLRELSKEQDHGA
jgi:ECF sigma factor